MKNRENSQKIAVILPAYNNVSSLKKTIRENGLILKKNGYIPRFIVIDDGSLDNTGKRARQILKGWPQSTLISFPFNRGKGCAVRAGFKALRDENFFLLLPADGQFDSSTLPLFLQQIHKADFVFGRRNRVKRPLKSRVLTTLHNNLMQLLFGLPLNDVNWVILGHTQYIEKMPLKCRTFAIEAELAVWAHRVGYKFVEVASHELQRNGGKGLGTNLFRIWGTGIELLALWGKLHLIGADEL